MPLTRVANINGAIIVLISLRNISLRNCMFLAISGKSKPNSAPTRMLINIQTVNDLLLNAKSISKITLKMRKRVKKPELRRENLKVKSAKSRIVTLDTNKHPILSKWPVFLNILKKMMRTQN